MKELLKETMKVSETSRPPENSGYPVYFFNQQETKERADQNGLMDIENSQLTADGLIAKMLEWDESEHGVPANIYDMTADEIRRAGKEMPKEIRRIE
jgi:hypothetical protein